MKRSYRKIILRTFKSTRSRFLSIFAIVALGVGFLAGLSATPVDMKNSMEAYMDDANFYDLRVVSTLGLTGEDVAALQAVQGVKQVQPGYSLDLLVQSGDDTLVARAHSLPPTQENAVNRLFLMEGRMPQNSGECLVEAGTNKAHPSHPIGEKLTALPADDLEDKLGPTEFTVVGIVHNANYFSFEREPASVGNGSVGLVLYLPESAFAYEAYTEIALTVDGALAQNSLGDDYTNTVDTVKKAVEGISDARCQARYDGLKADAQGELDDAWTEYNDAAADAEQELADAAAELADGREKLAEGEQEVVDGEQELLDGEKEIADNEAKVNDGATQLADALAKLQDGEDAWKKGSEKLADTKPELEAALRELREGQRQYDAGAQAYEEGENKLSAAKDQLDAAKAELDAGRAEYEAGKAKYEAGKVQYENGLVTYEEKKKKLEEAKAKLDAAKQKMDRYESGVRQAEQGHALYTKLCTLKDEQAAYTAGGTAAARALAAALAPATPGEPPLTEQQVLDYLAAQAALPPVAANPQTPESALTPSAPTTPEELRAGLGAFTGTAYTWLLTDEVQQNALVQNAAKLITARTTLDAALQQLVSSGAAPNAEAARQLLTPEGLAAMLAKLEAADAELAAGKPEYEAGKTQYEAGLAEWQAGSKALEAAGATLEATRVQLAAAEEKQKAGKEKLDAGQAKYDAGLAEWQSGKAALDESAGQLAEAKNKLNTSWRQYNEGLAAYENGEKELADNRKTLTDGWATLTDKQIELNDARNKLNDARQTLAEGKQDLAEARATLAEKTQELRDGEIEYEDAKAEVDEKLADAKEKIEDGEAELAKLELPEWYVWDRSNNVSYASFDGNVSKLQAITTVFPIFFFLVAALVVSSTMTRMVEEERLQIGTLKALGYRPGEIMQKYLLYALGASAAGTLAGLAVGFYAFPTIIWSAYTMMYYMPGIATPWLADKALFAGGALIGLSVGVTLLACRSSLTEVPAALLLPRAPKAGKRILLERITPVWRRLPFTYKVTARNLLRYKRRFWMTVLGVAGCTALLVAGFGISDSLNAIIENQYSRVYHYQLMTVLTEDASAESPVHDYLFGDAQFTSSLAVEVENLSEQTPDGSKVDAYLMIPEDTAAFAGYADLHDRKTGKATPLKDDGVVLTEKLASLYGVQAGDTVTLKNADEAEAAFTVTGVCEHYVYNYIYMSPAAYRAAYGTAPDFNAVLSLLPDDSQAVRDEISAKLLGQENVASVAFTKDSMQMVLNMLNSIDAVVVLIIVCAASLAFVVLYNLGNINIAERVKEIATIKVLGFYDREVDSYVNRESVALTLIGTLFGLVLGIWLHQFIIVTVEVDAVMFGREIQPLSFLYAAALTLLFSTAVNLVMVRALKRISMVESMKAPE